MAITQALGTTFSWNSVDIGELTIINGIEITSAFTDITTHENTDFYTRELPTLMTAGDITLEGFFDYTDTTGQQAMLTDMNSRTLRTVVITFPAATGATWTLTAHMASIKIGDADITGVIPFTATIKPYGKPTFAVATSTGISAMTISESAVLVPTWAIGTFDYVATVLTGISSVTFTPTFAAGVTTIDGNAVLTTVESSAIALGVAGSITEVACVNTETDKAPKTYTVSIVRAAS